MSTPPPPNTHPQVSEHVHEHIFSNDLIGTAKPTKCFCDQQRSHVSALEGETLRARSSLWLHQSHHPHTFTSFSCFLFSHCSTFHPGIAVRLKIIKSSLSPQQSGRLPDSRCSQTKSRCSSAVGPASLADPLICAGCWRKRQERRWISLLIQTCIMTVTEIWVHEHKQYKHQ